MFCELVSQASARLADVKGRARRKGDAINDIVKGARETVGDAEMVVIASAEKGSVRYIMAGAKTGVGTGEATWYGGRG